MGQLVLTLNFSMLSCMYIVCWVYGFVVLWFQEITGFFLIFNWRFNLTLLKRVTVHWWKWIQILALNLNRSISLLCDQTIVLQQVSKFLLGFKVTSINRGVFDMIFALIGEMILTTLTLNKLYHQLGNYLELSAWKIAF